MKIYLLLMESKLTFDSWVHLKSNTEPIIRIYSEAPSQDKADELGKKFISEMSNL